MKKILLILFCTQSIIGSAQDIVISAGAEKTVSGNQYGGSMMYETKKFWGAGVFGQTGVSHSGSENLLKDLFYGVVLQAPIAKCERISFVAIIRNGFVNEKYFVVVPSVETRIKITPKAGAAIGAGLRSGYPSLSVKLFIRIL
jgi:hypothetical protein